MSCIVIWFICGFLTHGIYVGSVHKNFPEEKEEIWIDRIIGSIGIVMGPIGLAAIILVIVLTPSVKMGFKL